MSQAKSKGSLSYDDIVKRSIEVAKKKSKKSGKAAQDDSAAPNSDQQVDITE